MPSQRSIEKFTLAFHVAAVQELRRHPEKLQTALAILDRWESTATGTGRVYRDTWRTLLAEGVDSIEEAVCVDSDAAATLRSTSPLGFVLDEAVRSQLRREAMSA
jgi:hypothetical protein